MLTVNPAKRITAADALKHPWICVSYRRRPSTGLYIGYTSRAYLCLSITTVGHTRTITTIGRIPSLRLEYGLMETKSTYDTEINVKREN